MQPASPFSVCASRSRNRLGFSSVRGQEPDCERACCEQHSKRKRRGACITNVSIFAGIVASLAMWQEYVGRRRIAQSADSEKCRRNALDAQRLARTDWAGTAIAAPAQPQSSRRRVAVGGRPIPVIDMHAHCVIPVTDIVNGTPLADSGGGRGGSILGPERLQLMDQQGVDIQALSINGYWWYAADLELARRIVRAQNEGLAKWVSAHPDRFVALASVALQHPELAAEQLEDGVKRLGLRGASIGGHANGEIFRFKATSRSGPRPRAWRARVHASRRRDELIKDGALRGRGDLGNIIGNPLRDDIPVATDIRRDPR